MNLDPICIQINIQLTFMHAWLNHLLFDDLHHIFILENVILAHLLWIMLHRTTPYICTMDCISSMDLIHYNEEYLPLELFQNGLVNLVTEIFHSALFICQDNRSTIIWYLALWLGIHTDQIQFLDILVNNVTFIIIIVLLLPPTWFPATHQSSTRDEHK